METVSIAAAMVIAVAIWSCVDGVDACPGLDSCRGTVGADVRKNLLTPYSRNECLRYTRR